MICLGCEVELGETKSILHLLDVFSKSVLTSQLSRELEMVDLLVVLHGLVNVLLVLEADASPQQVPFVLIGLTDVLRLENLF
jgi:hypothetical protein